MTIEYQISETFTLWLNQYGSFAIFGLLALGIFALPIPDETLLVLAGTLMMHGKLNIPLTWFAAFSGSCCGITISYFIGRTAGVYLVYKYGAWLGINDVKIRKVHEWFKRVGTWTLFICYFVPGIRHIAGYAAGFSSLEYKKFALFSYSGALLWSTMFLSLGYFMGDKWIRMLDLFIEEKFLFIVAILAVLILLLVFWWRRGKRKHSNNHA